MYILFQALLAFEEDRREKAMRDQREAETRRAAEAAGAVRQFTHDEQMPSSPVLTMSDSGGHVLGARPDGTVAEASGAVDNQSFDSRPE